MRKLHLPHAFLNGAVVDGVEITLDGRGFIEALRTGVAHCARDAEAVAGLTLPGIPNVHGHAHQRAMAGLAEAAGLGDDSFWTWRQVMYRFLARMTPDDLEAIAAQLYVEMLKAGYTAVGEFHYLHRQPDGSAYDNPAEMSLRILAAAGQAGIALTHLPALYVAGGFGPRPLGEAQRRFRMDASELLQLVEHLRMTARDHEAALLRVGIAPHSLRAAPPEELSRAVAGLRAIDAEAAIHIHVAEQTAEVEDCLAWSGRRPVEWLLDEMPVDRHWCLVHATHMTAAETARLAGSGAVAGLCPTTEANLGDGFFPARDFLSEGGRIGIGSDSHISVSPVEELRWLEYGERLSRRRRAVLAGAPGGSTGRRLLEAALAGGAQALAQPMGGIAVGRRCDLVVLDDEAPIMAGRSGDAAIDSFVFSGNVTPVRHVMVAGKWRVRDGHHADEAAIARRFRATMRQLMEV